jgi:uncharacterized radical SAM protein YgiQ
VTGDVYVDHPSFGMALIGRLWETKGFRVGILAQPDWTSVMAFREFGRPNLFFGVTGGNMDSMVNRYAADRRTRSDDAYTPNGAPNRRPDRCVLVHSHRCREAYKDVPIVLGGIKASLCGVAHYDYWSDKVRRSVLVDAKADLLVYGDSERQVVEIAHCLAARQQIGELTDIYSAPPSSDSSWRKDGRKSTRATSTARLPEHAPRTPIKLSHPGVSPPKAARSSVSNLGHAATRKW